MTVIYHPHSAGEILLGTLERIQEIDGFKLVQLNRLLDVKAEEDDQCPYALIYNGGEAVTHFGDANSGVPFFEHDLKIVIDIVLKELDQDDAFQDITACVEVVREKLLTDATWLELFNGLSEFSHELMIPDSGDQYLVGARLNIAVSFESEWHPRIENHLDAIEFTIRRGPNDIIKREFNLNENPNCLPRD